MKPTEYLADFIARTSFEDIPREVRDKSKWAILDGVAASFAGIPHEVGKTIISFVKDLGGKPVATILGDGHRTSAPWAAYANGTLVHAVDYDDVNTHLGGHPTAPVLAATLAAGEQAGVSGKEILLAFILGVETECKIGFAVNETHYNLGWHPTATLGTFGATAACGKILKLNREQMLMALGIAGSEASAIKQNFGTMTKPLHVGQTAKNGVLAAYLASRGWVADREILEGRVGFCNLFAGQGKYDLAKMTESLGRPFDILEPGIQAKKYPCCGSTHPSLDAILQLLKEQPFKADEVEKLECEVHPDRVHVLVHPDPKDGLEGKFSLEYCLARAILNGKISIADFEDERVKEERVRSFLSRIKASKNPSLERWGVRIQVKLKDGRTLKAEGTRSEGLTGADDLKSKYRDCLEGVLPPGNIERSFQMIQGLENVKNISELIRALVKN